MRPSEALRNHREAILKLAARLGVKNIRVFGSVLHGDDTESSDLDLLVDVPRGTTLLDMVHLQNEIEQELGVTVDVLTPGDLLPKIRTRVLQEARPL